MEASIELRLNRVIELTKPSLLRRIVIGLEQLTKVNHSIPQEIGLSAWETGIQALMVPSAADRGKRNLAVFLDNQRPIWRVELRKLAEH